MQLQNVVGETDQRPLAPNFNQAAQEELAKPAGLFDLAEDRLHDRFPCRVDYSSNLGLKLERPPPPEIFVITAVVTKIRISLPWAVVVRVSGGRLDHPSGGNDLLAVPITVVQEQLAELR